MRYAIKRRSMKQRGYTPVLISKRKTKKKRETWNQEEKEVTTNISAKGRGKISGKKLREL